MGAMLWGLGPRRTIRTGAFRQTISGQVPNVSSFFIFFYEDTTGPKMGHAFIVGVSIC